MSVIRKFLHLVTLVISSGVNSSGCVPRPSPTFAEFDPVESPSPDPIRDCCWIGAGGRWNVKLFKNLKKTKSYRRGIWSVWPWLELVCGSYSIILNLVLVKFCFRWKNKKKVYLLGLVLVQHRPRFLLLHFECHYRLVVIDSWSFVVE